MHSATLYRTVQTAAERCRIQPVDGPTFTANASALGPSAVSITVGGLAALQTGDLHVASGFRDFFGPSVNRGMQTCPWQNAYPKRPTRQTVEISHKPSSVALELPPSAHLSQTAPPTAGVGGRDRTYRRSLLV